MFRSKSGSLSTSGLDSDSESDFDLKREPAAATLTAARTGKAPPSLRHGMGLVFTSWVFGSLWMYTATGAVLTRFAKALHLSDAAFGILAALPFLAALAQIPASLIIEHRGWRRGLFFVFGVGGRALWMLLAAVPWLLPPSYWAMAFLALYGLTLVGSNAATPSWVSWMADLVPARLRGRFFSRRTQLGVLVGFVVTLAIGLLIDRLARDNEGSMRTITARLMFAAGAIGMLDHLCYLGVPHVAPRRRRPQPVLSMLGAPLRDLQFLRFLGFVGTLTLATGFTGQYVWLYLLDALQMSNFRANAMLMAVPLLVRAALLPAWGRLTDRVGFKPVAVIAGLFVVHGGAAWIFVTRDTWWWGFLVALLATAAWPGLEIANFNILLRFSETKGGQRSGSAYTAVHSLVVAVGGTLSGLLGAGVAMWLGPAWRGSLFGWPLTYHGVLMLISGALRLVSLLWLIGLHDPKGYSTRDTVRYVMSNVYSNLQQALFSPGRRMLRLASVTFKTGRPRRQR